MQENTDYVIHERSSANATGGEGLTTLNDGIFIGTKKYFFFIPTQLKELQTRKTITTTIMYSGELITKYIVQKLNERGMTANDFESFIINELKPELKSVQILSIDDDIEQFKIMTGFFGGGIATNATTRKIGWRPFVNKLGPKKKSIKQFYMYHDKLKNK